MQFFINIIDLSKMDDMNFIYEPGGHFIYRANSFAFKISQRLVGWETPNLATTLERHLPCKNDIPNTSHRGVLCLRFHQNTMDIADSRPRNPSERSIQ